MEHFDTLTAKKHHQKPKFSKLMFGCGSVTNWVKPLRHKEQTLTFLHTVLPTWEQVVNSSKCSTAPGLNIKITQSIVGFLRQNVSEDIRNTPFQSRQSFHNPAGMWLARFWIFFFVLFVCATSNLKLNKILTTLVHMQAH